MLDKYNINPYFDDYDENKNFYRMLFKPSSAVQARELTQIQSILQKQVERFGNHVFKNGSLVTGGQTFFQDATSIKINSEYSGATVIVDNFVGKTILSLDSTKRAEVIRVYDADQGTGDPKTLIIKQIYGEPFTNDEVVKTTDSSPYFAQIFAIGGINEAKIFSVNEGVFYYEGLFVKTLPQTIALSKYTSANVSLRVGFDVVESVVSSSSDTSLLDPALGSSNYQAPGADRVKVDLILNTRSIDSEDDELFIELVRIESSDITKEYKYPIYSVLEESLARRTYDESGNYTVKQFQISLDNNEANSTKLDITLSPGKAYVYGYEFETNSPTTLTVDKPRITSNTQNRRISAEYGNFIYTTDHYGSFPIYNLTTVDVHCVPLANIDTSTTATIANTKIGTARIKSVEFDSSTDISDSSTYTYRTFVFDMNINNRITGSVVSVNGNEITIGSGGSSYSSYSNTYVGAKFRIISGPGSGEPVKTITAYNGGNKTVTLNQPFIVTPTTSSVWNIEFEIKDAESFASFSSTTLQNGANVDNFSKDFSKTYQDVFISEAENEPLIYPLGQSYITPSTFSDMSYSYKRMYVNQSFSANVSSALNLGSGESIPSATTSNRRSENYYITVKQPNDSSYSVGQIIPSDKFTVDPITRRITVADSYNMEADITVTVNVSNPTRKSKEYIETNVNTIGTLNPVNVFGSSNTIVQVFTDLGQTHIKQEFVNKNPNISQSLYVSDVLDIVEIRDFLGQPISQANLASSVDVTSKYTLDNGQRDSYYDHASIRLKPSARPPVGPIVVFYNRFKSSGSGFFTVDSYNQIDYGRIPSYVSPKTNNAFLLRDCLDFRPVRFDAITGSGNNVFFDVEPSSTGPKIPFTNDDFIVDYSYFLPRIDRVVLDKNKKFEVLQGVSSLAPAVPNDTDTSMTLYILRYQPYVSNPSQVQVQYVNNKRYTMRDIGSLEKRIENLEYYTSLSLLEQETVTKQDLTIIDSENIPRFKNGILVDPFTGSSVADVTDIDYKASIDGRNKELRPSFKIYNYSLKFDSANSSGYLQSGALVTSQASSVILIDQPKASRFINVNPFNITNFLGKITLNPSSDIWYDINQKADVLVNLTGDRDAWELLAGSVNELLASEADWGSWQVIGTGEPVNGSFDVQNNRSADWQNLNAGVGGANDIVRHTTQTVEQSQRRFGTANLIIPETITQSLGNRIVDSTIIPYMRTKNILFVGTDFKPNSTVYPFFDNISVRENVGNRTNKFFLNTSNVELRVNLDDPETITIKDGSTVVGTAIVAHVSNNIIYVTNVIPTQSFANSSTSFTIEGQSTGKIYQVTGYEHNGASSQGASTNTITLRQDAAGATNVSTYVGKEIRIVQGTGAGQVKTITGYNPSTRVATVNSNWTTLPYNSDPNNPTIYSIGDMKVDAFGSVAGIFTIPEGKFRVGEKLFRLMDSPSGDLASSSTSGDASFFAQGQLNTVEETIVSTRVPQIQRTTVSDSRVVPVTTTTSRAVVWTDPLAQTFLVSPVQFPQGIFLNKIRICFKSKDDSIPVTLQIRPAVNGYPSSSVIYPFGTVTLTPDKVKVTDTPSLDDPTKYTDFIFNSPLYMQPGEHCFVLLANSNKYEIYSAEIGKTDLVTNRLISEQPYGGSLFLSQNGSTWTADQNSDMMFRLFRYTFSTNPVNAQFLVDFPDTSSVPYDLTHLITADVTLGNTALKYEFNSETLTGEYVGYKAINPFSDYDMNDGGGTRQLSVNKGETSFILNGQMQSTNPDISPFIDISRMGFLAVHNQINDLGLSNNNIVILNGGTGIVGPEDVTITISGGNGSGATAEATVVNGSITGINIVDAGSGYTTTPSINISLASGSGAQAIILGETSKRGGPAKARYITRRVTLNDGFDSSDLRVYLSVYKPAQSDVYVYAKMLSASDPSIFEDVEWQLLTPITSTNFVSTNKNDLRELIYAPGTNGVASNLISYTSNNITYNTFKTFAIKIVMSSTDSVNVPRIKELRAIALPGG
jgi:hypothetical protein